jgi:hypothetical protein
MNTILKLLLALALSGPVAAQQCTELLYTGAAFSTVAVTYVNPAYTLAPITGPLKGTITLSQPLSANMVNAIILGVSSAGKSDGIVTAWDFSSATDQPPLNSVNSPPFQNITVSTDANGNVTTWSMELTNWLYGTDPGGALTATSTNSGDTVDSQVGGGVGLLGTSTAPGTWTCLQSFTAAYTAPPPTPPPVDPLIAQLATAQATIVTLRAQVASLQAQLAAAQPAAVTPVVKATPVQPSGGGGAMGWDLLILLALLVFAALMRFVLRKSKLF